jgi:pimeloyl-ACP methyl ester carboxylesterase
MAPTRQSPVPAGSPTAIPAPSPVLGRRGVRLAGVALAVILGLAVGLAVDVIRVGGPRLWLARHGLPPPYVANGSLVDIGGRSLYLDCRGQRLGGGSGVTSPTVVLISGMGSGAGTWSPVLDDLAASTRTCAYDRAGLGGSDARGVHTLADAVDDLRTLLEAAGEHGPFVVVGHSLGGDHARLFGSVHRDEVVGVLLVDPFDPDLEAAFVHPLLGALRPEYDARLDGLRSLVASVEQLDWTTSEAQLRSSSLAGLPVEVLHAPRVERRLDAAANADIAAAWEGAFESLSPGDVRYTIAWGAGHMVQFDRPDLVVEAVERLIEAARRGP